MTIPTYKKYLYSLFMIGVCVNIFFVPLFFMKQEQESTVYANDSGNLGNWTDYNGIVFGEAELYQTVSGGALAVKDTITVHSDFTIGSTYTALYNPTQDIGEYTNAEQLPAFLFGGEEITIADTVRNLNVHGGTIAMSSTALTTNETLPTGFTPQTNSSFQEIEQSQIKRWFTDQQAQVKFTSQQFLKGNSHTIELSELGSGSYLSRGSSYFENEYFTVDDEIYDRVLFINVNCDSDVAFGQWWPVHSQITIDVNWAIAYDLIVFNFPNAINVSMNASTFNIRNMSHWSTTVDAWIGVQGMIERLALSEKVIYNFPNASNMEVSEALVQGTILAPKASFTGIGRGDAGHLYGHLIVENYRAENNFTIHAFTLNDWVHDIVAQNIEEELVTTASIQVQQFLYFGDNQTDVPVSGGQFVLINDRGKYYNGNQSFVDTLEDAQKYTVVNYQLQIEAVPLGEYILQNIRAPNGFSRNTTDKGNMYTYYSKNITLSTEDQVVSIEHYVSLAQADFTFKKVDAHTNEGLANAKFQLLREGDQYQTSMFGANYVSEDSGEFQCLNLTIGKYILLEIEPPQGHGLLENGEYHFTVIWDEEQERLMIQTETQEILSGSLLEPIEIKNSKENIRNSALIIKYIDAGNEEQNFYTLANAHFDVFQYDTTLLTWKKVEQNKAGDPLEVMTNEFGYYRAQNMDYGTYRIVETIAPNGYEVSNPYTDIEHLDVFPTGYAAEFIFDDDNFYHLAYVKNRVLTTSVRIHLYSDFLNQNTPLYGGTFSLEKLLEEDTWEVLYSSRQTSITGNLVFQNLEVGRYRLTQIASATGYSRLEPHTIIFDITYTEDNIPLLEVYYEGQIVTSESQPIHIEYTGYPTISINNQAKTRDLSLYKMDANYEQIVDENENTTYVFTFLENAVFRLQRKNPTFDVWEDYGDAFYTQFQYDENGQPIVDNFNNHISQAHFTPGLLYGEYRIIEIAPPPGYVPSSNTRVTLNDGVTGNLIYSFRIAEAMTGINGESKYTLTNYSQTDVTQMRFKKVDTIDTSIGLKNATFALYSCDIHHEHDPLATFDSCWSINTPVIVKSNEEGIVTLSDLKTSTYILQEVTAPSGYDLPLSQWILKVNATYPTIEITTIDTYRTPDFLSTENTEGYDYILPNMKKIVLPLTGGAGVTAMMVTGSGMIVIAYILLFRKRRQ